MKDTEDQSSASSDLQIHIHLSKSSSCNSKIKINLCKPQNQNHIYFQVLTQTSNVTLCNSGAKEKLQYITATFSCSLIISKVAVEQVMY